MALADYEKFVGVTSVQEDLLNENLLYGVIAFMRWASLNIGAFQNVTRISPASSGVFGGTKSRLRPVVDPNYTNGQVWEGFRGDWVWESGLVCSATPIRPTGVYINSTFYPLTTAGTYSHYIDYPRGRVIFNSALGTSSGVETDFSPRTINFISAEEKWFKELMFQSHRVERSDFLTAASGKWAQNSESRAQLPVVGVEIVANRQFEPYQLGGGQYIYQDVLFHVMSDNPSDAHQWTDIISFQNDRAIWIPNKKWMKDGGKYPPDLNYRGEMLSSPLQYSDIVKETGVGGYAWRKIVFTNTNVQNIQQLNNWLYHGIVRTRFLILMENL